MAEAKCPHERGLHFNESEAVAEVSSNGVDRSGEDDLEGGGRKDGGLLLASQTNWEMSPGRRSPGTHSWQYRPLSRKPNPPGD